MMDHTAHGSLDAFLARLFSHPHQLIEIHPLVVGDMAEALPELRQAVFGDHDQLGRGVLI